ncbi:MAG: Head fiber protein [Clostridia bacterium]|nr:Head fiber protein [Clostridia bacterium]
MTKADPEKDVTRNTHNYFAHGGNELVIGGQLTFLPGATVEGGDDLFGSSGSSFDVLPYIQDSEATTIAALKDDFNSLLEAMRQAGFINNGK